MKYTKNQLDWASENLGHSYCSIENGIIKNIHTDEIIPLELTHMREVWADGQYKLGDMTCGGGMTNGIDGEHEPTPENIEKYQCRVGRQNPTCSSYYPKKCAVYSLGKIDQYDEHISFGKLIAISGVN